MERECRFDSLNFILYFIEIMPNILRATNVYADLRTEGLTLP
ncbi:hypothetical protein [Thioclava sp. L04-15]|nr:hypothetical protein [Thioclava sp. L04-15]